MPQQHLRFAVALLVAACETAAPERRTQRPTQRATTRLSHKTAKDTTELPQPAPAIEAAALRGRARCGPFDTSELDAKDRALLDDRLRVRFLPGAQAEGDAEAGRLQIERDGVSIFVGARETYARGDELFERRAAKVATFGGAYDPLTIPGRDGKLSIVTGIVRAPDPERELLAVAHGWFLDPNRDVLDVAVFVSSSVEDLTACKRFAQQVLATVANGPRRLRYGTDTEIVTEISYAKFRYRLPSDWIMTGGGGIHDFARIRFRKRGLFPEEMTTLELGLDSHPGDWSSEGTADGERQGRLLGLAVTWKLTKTPLSAGAWTISDDVAARDHAVASIYARTAADRDAAIAFAESIRVD